jgi:outer membrane protein
MPTQTGGKLKMNRRFTVIPWLILAALFVWQPIVFGGSSESGNSKLSLSDAIATALKQNPNIEMAASQLQAAGERVVQAKSGFYPQIDFTEGYKNTTNPMWAFGTKLNQGVITDENFDPGRLNDPSAVDNFASSFVLAWPVYDSGQTWYGRHQAELGEKSAELSLERVRHQVVAETSVGYAGLLLSLENLGVVEQTLETSRANLKMVQSRFDAGFFVKSDLLRAQVRIARLEQQLSQAQSMVEIAKAALNAAMGVSMESTFELVTPFEVPQQAEGDLEGWIIEAMENRPDYQQAKYHEEIAAKEVAKTKAAHLPSLNLVGNYEVNTERWEDFADNYTVGALLKFNLYSGNRMTAKQREAMALLQAAKANVHSNEIGIRMETRQAFFQAKSARESVRVTQSAIEQSEENLRIIRNRYNNGLETIVTLLDSEVALQQSRTDHFRKLHDYQVAVARLELAAGVIGGD